MNRTILDEIVEKRRETLAARFSGGRVRALEEEASRAPRARDFFGALSNSAVWGIIAEIKAKSPSKGVLLASPDPRSWAALYENAGAAAISVVTEENYFNGNPDWIGEVKNASALPVLRKDFFTTPEEILECRAIGADAVLLIAAVLEKDRLARLVDEVLALGMEPLVEVHSPEEAEAALQTKTRIIGVNNRNLRDFTVSLDTTRLILPSLKGRLTVSESGIGSRQEIEELFQAGVKAFLIGETFLTAADPKAALSGFASAGRGAGKS